jgi:two-component system response regulator
VGLASQLSSSYKKDPNIEIIINSDDIFLNVETAIPCGLIINEILSNSLKHAFSDELSHLNKGEILVELRTNQRGKYVLSISDNGAGIPEGVEFPYKGSFGFRMVNTLIKQLGGIVEFDGSEGTSYQIQFEELRYTERIKLDSRGKN